MARSNLLLDILFLDMWYGKKRPWLSALLLPLSGLFYLLISGRRCYYRWLGKGNKLPVPVIVVGNINLGGSGKSPLLIALALRLRQLGYAPGIISRGYGGSAPCYPLVVDQDTAVAIAGDEPLMIARQTACPVVIDPDRLAAARKLMELKRCDVILSDDGLQHYRLRRDLEIVVVDGGRQLGNGRLLPAGPLREPAGRLRQADWVVVNGQGSDASPPPVFSGRCSAVRMQLQPVGWRRLADGRAADTAELPWPGKRRSVHAVAGIGNPQRFFATLRQLGLEVIPHGFPDHHPFQWQDICFADDLPVIMTEKDAVKCRGLLAAASASEQGAPVVERYWYLSVRAQLDDAFFQSVHQRLRALSH